MGSRAASTRSTMSTASPHERRSVLVVEDEPILRASMVRGISKLEGVDVTSTGTVLDARRCIHARPPDLVITDLDLPDGSGIEVVGELDRVGLRVPIVVVSAYVGQYRGRLPRRAGTEVFEKPISLDRLRRIVDERLRDDADAPSSPFGVTDYIQLAGMGRRSVLIEVRGGVAGRGEVVIKSGDVWSARDEQGEGLEAFRRLAFLEDVVVTCRALDHAEGRPRTIEGSCESVLLEAARRRDEGDVSSVDSGWEADTDPPSTAASGENERAFAESYERGVDALLAKRFDEAYRAFFEADEISPGDSRVNANLERLRQMGYGQ